MVEVHLVGVERRATIQTRACAELAEEFDVRLLADPYTSTFVVAVPFVVADVRGSLARTHRVSG
jgi:hypothetical protein